MSRASGSSASGASDPVPGKELLPPLVRPAARSHSSLEFHSINMAFPGGRLSVGSVAKIFSTPDYNQPVVLQVLEVKKMTPSNKQATPGDRFRYVSVSPLVPFTLSIVLIY